MIPAAMIPYLIRAGIVAAVLLALWGGVKIHDHNIVRAEQEKAAAVLVKANEKARADIAKTEQTLAENAAQQKGQDDEKISRLNTNLAAVQRLLQSRTRRPATKTSAPAITSQTCTGAGLFREDADFLVGESAAADSLTIDLDTCTKLYNNARAALASVPK